MPPFTDAISAIFIQESGRLWNVVVPPHIYTKTLALLRALGEVGPAPRPIWVFVAPALGPSRGWPLRVQELAREGSGAGPFPSDTPDPAAPFPAEARNVFARVVAASALAGLVVVLAPQHIDDARAYAADIGALVTDPELRAVRWVVMDAVQSSLSDLAERLGDGMHRVVQPTVDQADEEEFEQVLADLEARRASLSPELDARIATHSLLRAPDGFGLRRLLHEADNRSQVGRHFDAAQLRTQAQTKLAAMGLREEAVYVAMEAARSFVAGGAPEEGQRVFVSALREAERLKMTAIVPEAYASLGSLHSSQQRFAEAMEAYTRAGQLAERRGSRALAADMRRCAGHAALNANMPDTATDAWTRAFALLDASAPTATSLEKAQQLVVLGLTLAEVFEERGNMAAAGALRGHAEEIERRNPRPAGSFS
jgi:tetratricopeptide (TPR) repeat protein